MKKFIVGCTMFVTSLAYADPSIIVLDSSGRIRSVFNENTISSFKYDDWNNVSSEEVDGKYVDYHYSDNEELISIGNECFKYDELGRLTKKGSIDISYNAYNMMSKFGDSEYFYDPKSGLRCGKLVDGISLEFTLEILIA